MSRGKNTANAVMVAAALTAAGSALAQEKPSTDAVCGENQTKVVSALNGVVGCKDASLPGNPEVTVVPRATLEEIAREDVRTSHRSDKPFQLKFGAESSSVFGTGVNVTAQGGSEKLQAGVNITKQQDAKRGTVAVSGEVADGLILTAGASMAAENAAKALGNPEYAGMLKASQGFVRLDIAPLGMDMRMAITAIVGSSSTVELRTTSTSELLVRTEDLPTVLRTIEETWTTTTKTSFQGSTWQKVLADAAFNVGSNGAVTIRLGGAFSQSADGNKSALVGGATWTQYQFLGGEGKLSVSGDTLGTTSGGYTAGARYEWPINKQVAAFVGAGVTHSGVGPDNAMALAGVNITLDGDNTAQFQRPTVGSVKYTAAQALSTVLGNTGVYGISSVAATGRVVQTTTRTLNGTNTTDTPKNVNTLVAGGAFASLTDMTVSDNYGSLPISIDAGGVTDSLGGTITYSASGLPSGLSIDPSTGVISGIHDAIVDENYTVTITASNGTNSIQKIFILTVRNDG